MKGTITYIGPWAKSRLAGDYRLVNIRLESGETAKTYLSPSNRNWKNWEHFETIGAVLDGLVMKGPGLIDADSPISLVS